MCFWNFSPLCCRTNFLHVFDELNDVSEAVFISIISNRDVFECFSPTEMNQLIAFVATVSIEKKKFSLHSILEMIQLCTNKSSEKSNELILNLLLKSDQNDFESFQEIVATLSIDNLLRLLLSFSELTDRSFYTYSALLNSLPSTEVRKTADETLVNLLVSNTETDKKSRRHYNNFTTVICAINLGTVQSDSCFEKILLYIVNFTDETFDWELILRSVSGFSVSSKSEAWEVLFAIIQRCMHIGCAETHADILNKFIDLTRTASDWDIGVFLAFAIHCPSENFNMKLFKKIVIKCGTGSSVLTLSNLFKWLSVFVLDDNSCQNIIDEVAFCNLSLEKLLAIFDTIIDNK